jgi:phage gp36-like protein
MDYCTIQDLETHLSTPTLTQLTCDEGNVIDPVVAEEAIIYASTLINGYLRGRHKLPLSASSWLPALNGITGSESSDPSSLCRQSAFPLLRILTIDIAVYRLYSRRMRTEIPEIIAQQYKDAIKMLQDIQKGVMTLESTDEDNETPAELQSGEYRSNKTASDRLFNRTVLSEY